MTFLLAIVGGLLGLILGWVVTAAAVIIIGAAIGASDFEGQLSMGAIFGFGPMGGLVGLALGIWLAIRFRRKPAATGN